MKSQTIRFRNMNTDIADKVMPEGSYRLARNCRPNNLNSGLGGVIENIKNTLALPSLGSSEQPTTITDYDGNVYSTVVIGAKRWLIENLKTTKYNDGSSIPNVTDGTEWSNLSADAYCEYNNNPVNSATYGLLYNWYSINTGKLAPNGCHVATRNEWNELLAFLGDYTSAGGKLKEIGLDHWNSPNAGATDEYGFKMLGNGGRGQNGSFVSLKQLSYLGTSSEYDSTNTYSIVTNSSTSILFTDVSSLSKKWGVAVRCVVDDAETTGVYKYKGGCNDYKRNSIIAFYEGSTNNFITSYDTKTGISIILMSTSSIDFGKLITHSAVLDDHLFWIDADNKMRKINVVGSDPTLNFHAIEDTLVDKYPPILKPVVEAQVSASFSGNNINNKIFQFAYAYEYSGSEVSSWSPISKSVLPESTGGLDVEFPNNEIKVSLSSGSRAVKKIHIAYRIGTNGDWKLTEILDNPHYGIEVEESSQIDYFFHNNKFKEALVNSDVLSNTYNPFYEFGTLALSRDNFVIAGLVKDGLPKPTNIHLALRARIQSSTERVAGYKFGAVHEFGLVFRDENGRTDGVNAITSVEIPFFTDHDIQPIVQGIADLNNIPYSDIEYIITGSAPTWAVSMSIVYLGNKTMSSFVDYALTDIEDVGAYTYLDITNLNTLKDATSVLDPQKPSSNISAYTFTKGDRIRFITDKNGVVLDSTTDKYDYEILGYVPNTTDSAGNTFYENNIYVNKITNWSSLNIGVNSMFEIYTPKTEFADNVYFEIGEICGCTNGIIETTTDVLTDGDVYDFNRDVSVFELGELIADKELTYINDDNNPVGFTLQMNVIKPAEGVRASSYTINDVGGSFYHNTSGVNKVVQVTGSYDFTSESDNGYQFKIRLRTEGATITPEYVIFSEPNHVSSGDRVNTHKGTIANTYTVANGQYLGLYIDNNDSGGRTLLRTAPDIKLSVRISDWETGEIINSFVESKDYSDYFSSDEHSFGRPYVEIPEENTAFKNNIVYSGKYFADTHINDTHRFDPINVKYVPYEFGFITALRVRGDVLKVFTGSKELSYYLGKEAYNSGGDTNGFILTNSPIGSINVYDSDYGTENPESLMMTGNSVYYFDRKNASLVRTSNNGQLDIAEYGFKTRLRELTALYNANITTSNVFVGFNDKNNEVIVCFVINGQQYTAVFNERDNTWSHFIDMEDVDGNPPQGIINYGEILVVYVDGAPYQFEAGNDYNTFFGDTKSPVVVCYCNQEPLRNKIFQSLAYEGVGKWNIGITTPPVENYADGQYTQILKGRQKDFEGIHKSDISRNLKNKQGIINPVYYATGQPMRGQVATLTLTNEDTTHVVLDAITVNYIDSMIS